MTEQNPDELIPWERPDLSTTQPLPSQPPIQPSATTPTSSVRPQSRSARIRKLNKVTAIAASAALVSVLAVGTGITAANTLTSARADPAMTQSGTTDSGSATPNDGSDSTDSSQSDDDSGDSDDDDSSWSILGLEGEDTQRAPGGSTTNRQRGSQDDHGSSGQS